MLIDASDCCLDPANVATLCEMEQPSTGATIQKFFSFLNLVRSAIPKNYAALFEALQNFLKLLYVAVRQRTRRGAARIKLARVDWGATEQAAFDAFKAALSRKITLALH